MPPSLFSPPESIVHGVRCAFQAAAKTTFGFPGNSSKSAKPVLFETNRTFSQVTPPSIVLYTPRSSLALKALPIAATHTILLLVGSISTAPI